jgi:putative ABC transport system ATP-binding protein
MLKLENISYRYKNSDRDVLKDISVSFENGKTHAVAGPSGSGKTTLLSIMAGLDKPTQGDVFIDGEKLSAMDLNQYRRERVSMIFQAFQLFPLLTAIENVCQPMEMNNVSRKNAAEKAKSLLESVGIDASKHKRYPANLSGGEQQRVAIARSLASGARVLLADEPTGNLDKENGDAVMAILRKLAHEEGYCVIVVTHNTEIAEASDAIYRMSDGVLKG